MPSVRPKKSHPDCLKLVCFFCMSKGNRNLTKLQKTFIVEYEFSEYEAYKTIFPSGVCESCSRIVNEKIKSNAGNVSSSTENQKTKNDSRILPKQNYVETLARLQKIPPTTRSKPVCQCFICQIAKKDCILRGVKKKVKKENQCPNCYAKLKSGKSHKNCNRQGRVENLMKDVTPRTRLKLALETLREEQAKKSSNSPIQVSRLSGGPSMPIYVGSEVPKIKM